MVKETAGLRDIGVSEKDREPAIISPGTQEKYKKRYPTVSFETLTVPELADYDVGETVVMTIKAKVTNKGESYSFKDNLNIVLEIKEVAIENEKEERKEANRLGIDKEIYDKVMEKRKERGMN
jgi:hypothetical protein